MMKKVLSILISFQLTVSVAQTASNGFFVMIPDKTNCLNLVAALTGPATYCLPKDPVISSKEFESVSDVKYIKSRHATSFDLKLSDKGFKTLKTLGGKMPDIKLILVIEGNAVGIFEVLDKKVHRTLPIYGSVDSPDVGLIHDNLKRIISR